MDEVLAEATAKGMYLVDHDNTGPLFEEYEDALMEADALCEINDPVEKPFESKYKARTLLDQIINKLDATRAIATLEKKTSTVEQVDKRIACARVRVGTISWECEEPHNAQTDLDLSCQFYFPGLVDKIIEMSAEDEVDESGADGSINKPEKVITSEDIKTPPELSILPITLVVDAMKTLNILGILWAGRGQVQKSMLYLLSARQFYLQQKDNIIKTAPYNILSSNLKKILTDLGYVYTHNLYYLAQAYGNIGDTKTSCLYCHHTLQRQYIEGFKNIRSSLDWIKNCCSISDFYSAMNQYHNCALALGSAEYILRKYSIPRILNTPIEDDKCIKLLDATNTTNVRNRNYITGEINALEIEAELSKRWAILDVHILKTSFERIKNIENSVNMGLDPFEVENLLLKEENENIIKTGDFHPMNFLTEYSKKNYTEPLINKLTGDDPPLSSVFEDIDEEDNSPRMTLQMTSERPTRETMEIEFFRGIPVKCPVYLNTTEIKKFEDARIVFLRAAGRIEAAKKYYVLDGYVTEHVTLTQEHSKLYHYLAVFEPEPKRKLAMEARRFDMLSPLLKALNKSSFEVLHKQISYELGEGALAMLEMKLDKFRSPATLEVNLQAMKKADIAKCNEYCKAGLVMFAHFTYMYAANKDRDANCVVQALEERQLYELVEYGCINPDESFITEEEVRPFLNAHFLSCRIMSKIITTPLYLPPNATTAQRGYYLIAILKRYDWLQKFAIKICLKHNMSLQDTFGDEHQICVDMVKLLPSKIDRMCFYGESGLSL